MGALSQKHYNFNPEIYQCYEDCNNAVPRFGITVVFNEPFKRLQLILHLHQHLFQLAQNFVVFRLSLVIPMRSIRYE